jgi:hypothetical protein
MEYLSAEKWTSPRTLHFSYDKRGQGALTETGPPGITTWYEPAP